jgi:hypothetical protein
MQPQSCPRGAYCPRGTPVAIGCPSGTFSESDSLESEAGCLVCPLGYACLQRTSVPEPCSAGRFGVTRGQTSRDCTGPCLAGHFCTKGSTSNTSGVCPIGRFRTDIGGTNPADCLETPRGTYTPVAGSKTPTSCDPGEHNTAISLPFLLLSFCRHRCAYSPINSRIATLPQATISLPKARATARLVCPALFNRTQVKVGV